MSNDKPYDFIDPEQYERKQSVQRAVEAKEGKESGKVGGGSSDSPGMIHRIKTAVGGFFF